MDRSRGWVSSHQFSLAPFGVSPILDGSLDGPLVALSGEGDGVIVLTGIADGRVWVSVTSASATAAEEPDRAVTGWEVLRRGLAVAGWRASTCPIRRCLSRSRSRWSRWRAPDGIECARWLVAGASTMTCRHPIRSRSTASSYGRSPLRANASHAMVTISSPDRLAMEAAANDSHVVKGTRRTGRGSRRRGRYRPGGPGSSRRSGLPRGR